MPSHRIAARFGAVTLGFTLVAGCQAAGPRPPRTAAPVAQLHQLLNDSLPIDPPAGCFHLDRPWTEYWCPEIVRRRTWIPLDSVDRTWLIVRTMDGTTYARRIPNTVDAIFLTPRAARVILVGYYRSIGQNAKADSLDAAINRLTAP